MQGYQDTQTPGFQKVVFESRVDTYAGGVCMDSTAAAAAFPSTLVIPAGTPVSRPDPASGLSSIVTASGSAGSAAFNKTLLGYVYKDVKIDNNCLVGVVVAGQMRYDAAPANVQTYEGDFMTKLPTVRIVRY